MKRYFLLMTMMLSTGAWAADAEKVAAPDCKPIIEQLSSFWINEYADKLGGSTIDIETALGIYGKCYDQQIQQVKDELIKNEKYPLMGARGNFQDMTTALDHFVKLALEATSGGGTFDRIAAGYANLYKKQFEYYFYLSFTGRKMPLRATDGDIEAAKKQLAGLIRMNSVKSPSLAQAFAAFKTSALRDNQMPEYAVYKYAISILIPASAKPCEPPF